MKKFFLILIFITPFAHAGDEDRFSREPYYDYSKDSEWYDSYGRLRRGYQDAPMKQYPPGKEPYYYYSESSPWYDSYGRLRYGPRGISADEYNKRK